MNSADLDQIDSQRSKRLLIEEKAFKKTVKSDLRLILQGPVVENNEVFKNITKTVLCRLKARETIMAILLNKVQLYGLPLHTQVQITVGSTSSLLFGSFQVQFSGQANVISLRLYMLSFLRPLS